MLSIIIITYNSAGLIKKCLCSIRNNRLTIPYRIIVIDNNSQDKTIETIENLGNTEIVLIKNNKNAGFAKAVNQGLKYAMENFPDAEYFLLLNPDAYLEKDCLEKLIKESEKKQLDLASPLIINPDTRKPWFSGAKISWLKQKNIHAVNHQSLATHYLSGCALLIKKEVLEKIGFFDEIFFLYYEDADFSLRTSKSGLKIGIIPNAICYHRESQSSDSETKTYYLVKSGLIFFHKHYPRWAFPWFWTVFWTRQIYHKNFSRKTVVLKAMEDFHRLLVEQK